MTDEATLGITSQTAHALLMGVGVLQQMDSHIPMTPYVLMLVVLYLMMVDSSYQRGLADR